MRCIRSLRSWSKSDRRLYWILITGSEYTTKPSRLNIIIKMIILNNYYEKIFRKFIHMKAYFTAKEKDVKKHFIIFPIKFINFQKVEMLF